MGLVALAKVSRPFHTLFRWERRTRYLLFETGFFSSYTENLLFSQQIVDPVNRNKDMKPISYGQYTTAPLQKSSSLHKFPKKWSKNVHPKIRIHPKRRPLRQGFAGGKPPFSMLFFAFCHKRLTFKRREGCCPLFEVHLSYLFDKLEFIEQNQ